MENLYIGLLILELFYMTQSASYNSPEHRPINQYTSARNDTMELAKLKFKAMHAAYVHKTAIAQSSTNTATTAEAAFFGKYVTVRSLEKLSQQAHHALTAEITQLEILKKAVSMATITAQQADQYVDMLDEMLQSAHLYADKARKSANYAKSKYGVQLEVLADAKEHLKLTEKRLADARNSAAEMQVSAEEANGVAQEAQSYAVSAAILASVESQPISVQD